MNRPDSCRGAACPWWWSLISGFFLLDAMQAFGVLDRLAYGDWPGKPGDKITQGLNLLLIISSLMLFTRGYLKTRYLPAGAVFAVGMICFLFVTALWSTTPSTTIREATVYFFVVVGAVGLAATLTANELMGLLSTVCLLSALSSLALVVVSPGNAIGEGTGDFRGIFAHKNFLGQVMATGTLGCLHCIRTKSRGGLFGATFRFLTLILFGGMAFASGSTAALLASFVFCCVSVFFSLRQRGRAARLTSTVIAAVLVPVVVLIAAMPDTILELIGKDPTLTGRTEIWAYVMSDISIKPWLGWGYFGFWNESNYAAVEISDALQWVVPQAHNGLLEMLLNVGLVGTCMFCFLLIRTCILAHRCLGGPDRALGISTLICCIGIVQVGISETVLLAPTQCLTPVFFVSGFMCENALRSFSYKYRSLAIPARSLVSVAQ